MATKYLPELKSLLQGFYEAANKVKDEIAGLPEEERSSHEFNVMWELEDMKQFLISRVGKEMVRDELGIENKVVESAFLAAKEALVGFWAEHARDFTGDDLDGIEWGVSGGGGSGAGSGETEEPAEAAPLGPIETKTLHLVAEATAIEAGSENKFPFLIVQKGLSKNRKNYGAEALRAGAPLFNDAPIYLDHPEGVHEGRPRPRNFADKVGWWSDAKFADASSKHPAGIVATANIMSNSAHPWLGGMIREAVESGKPNLIGVSIYVDIEAQPVRDDTHGVIYNVMKLTNVRSADLVAEPAAGGRALVAAESLMEVDPKMGDETPTLKISDLTDDQLRDELLPRLKALGLNVAEQIETPPPASPPANVVELPAAITEKLAAAEAALGTIEETSKRLSEREKKLALRESKDSLAVAMRNAKLPPGVIEIAVGESDGVILDEDGIQAVVERYKQVVAEGHDEMVRRLPPTQRAMFGVDPLDRQINPVERALNALDVFFGNEVAEDVKAVTPRITSFKQFYGQMTGDWEVNGVYNLAEAALGDWIGMSAAEAIPTQAKFVGGSTITMPNLLGLSMNRRLLGVYRGQTRWWEPISVQGPLSNFKEQDRIRTNNYGPLTNRPVGTEEYTELTWGETVEKYTPSGWGNIVSVNRRAIINDDLNGIRRQPQLLARAATVTINEYVSGLFTANAGAGVTMQDTNPAFHASRTNVGALALTYANLMTVRGTHLLIADNAGNKLLSQLRHLIVPVQLSDAAWIMVNSDGVPGSNNNDPNLFANRERGIWSIITVPNFTDSNNWYASVDPEESGMVPIEVGFINGNSEPELFIQDGPTEGMVFTNDGVYFKVRFEFGADIIDAIAMNGQIVTGA